MEYHKLLKKSIIHKKMCINFWTLFIVYVSPSTFWDRLNVFMLYIHVSPCYDISPLLRSKNYICLYVGENKNLNNKKDLLSHRHWCCFRWKVLIWSDFITILHSICDNLSGSFVTIRVDIQWFWKIIFVNYSEKSVC